MKRQDRFEAVDCAGLTWTRAVMPDGSAKDIEYATVFSGGGGLPMVHLNRYGPGWTEPRHRHAEDEVLILTQGEITVEGATYRAPATVFVSRGTLYGPLTSGPEGVTFYRVGYTEEMIRPQELAAAE